MTSAQIVRAWKDADTPDPLRSADEATAPNPAGSIELPDDLLGATAGGQEASTEYLETLGCCKGFTESGKCDVTIGFPYCTCQCLTIFWTTKSVCGDPS